MFCAYKTDTQKTHENNVWMERFTNLKSLFRWAYLLFRKLVITAYAFGQCSATPRFTHKMKHVQNAGEIYTHFFCTHAQRERKIVIAPLPWTKDLIYEQKGTQRRVGFHRKKKLREGARKLIFNNA